MYVLDKPNFKCLHTDRKIWLGDSFLNQEAITDITYYGMKI